MTLAQKNIYLQSLFGYNSIKNTTNKQIIYNKVKNIQNFRHAYPQYASYFYAKV